MARVTKTQTLNANKTVILCIAEGKNVMQRWSLNCESNQNRMTNQEFRVRIELIEICEFLSRCLGKIFFFFLSSYLLY